MNADPQVMEFFVSVMTPEESGALVDPIEAGFAKHGLGLWAMEEIEAGRFIGYTGLMHQTFEAHLTPAVEIGWRLASTPGERAMRPRPRRRRSATASTRRDWPRSSR